ncbi:hypothetical protein WH50_22680 [Pokkaliibacter plantistimulans]|uniref:Uncharacterized protein n=1 Tax=Pokkaliibacter plantistimulans TaxID=1635171 RepID=A0ABX5LR44_9GAMM|nr:hypothetical protein WH50_22680 [Pokkaliibacter plantistimulans]
MLLNHQLALMMIQLLERVTRVSVSTLLLMGIDVMGVVGTLVIGPILKRSVFASISIPILGGESQFRHDIAGLVGIFRHSGAGWLVELGSQNPA